MTPISDEALLELIQRRTTGYFQHFAHPTSGMARERNHPYYQNVVTTGGSGFGLMALTAAVAHGWMTASEYEKQLHKVLGFLSNCQRFHGAFAHWYDGNTGKAIAFGKKDDGADLVETSFLMMGLLTVRQYLQSQHLKKYQQITNRIHALWHMVEWDWFCFGENVLYWHWTPHHRRQIGLKIEGYNEALVTYIMAAASPAHSVAAQVYHQGWARNGSMLNGKKFYNTVLPLGPDYGGPLFFSQLSFLGLDPRALTDKFTNYMYQNRAHAKINLEYCIQNPKNYKGYGTDCWGLSACDSGKRFKPLSPLRDNGTICPSAAIASLPYLPQESMRAIRHFYFDLGKKIWGPFGFFDAFNKSRSWYARSYLAVNQGPIAVMIENYRSGLLWNLFMSCPEVKNGLQKLGFKGFC